MESTNAVKTQRHFNFYLPLNVWHIDELERSQIYILMYFNVLIILVGWDMEPWSTGKY